MTPLSPSNVIADRYTPLVELGESPSATTYLALDGTESRNVVLRLPSEALIKEPSFPHLLEREALELLRVRHPHIVRVLDVGRHEGVPFVVTEYVQGDSLAQRLTPAPAPQTPTQVYAWLLDCAEALDFIHAKKATHRDVGPMSILFSDEDDVRLTDFAIARALDALGHPVSVPHGNGLRPHLLAPEMRTAGIPTPGADQYALAATVFEAVTGHPLTLDLEGAAAALRSQVSDEAASDVLRALSPDASQRFPSCYEFARAFGLERRRPPRRPLASSPLPRIITSDGSTPAPVLPRPALLPVRTPPTDRPRVPSQPAVVAPVAPRLIGVGAEAASTDLPSSSVARTGPGAMPGQPDRAARTWGESVRCWRVQVRAPEVLARRAMEAGFVSPGWDELGDLRPLAESPDPRAGLEELLAAFGRAYGVSGMRARLGAAQVWRFVRGMSPGDIVLVPSPAGEALSVGMLRGPYLYVAAAPDGLGQAHRRAVDWLLEVPLAGLPFPIQAGIDGPQPIQCLDAVRDEVRSLVVGAHPAGDMPSVPRSVLEVAVAQLQAAEPDAFADAIAAWAAAEGLDVELLPGPMAEQWEAIGMLSAITPVAASIRLWIHRTRTPLDERAVLEARGALGADEMGTLVSLGGFTRAARDEAAAPGKKSLRLLDGPALAGCLLRRWERIPQDIQRCLGVSRNQRAVVTTHFEAKAVASDSGPGASPRA